jgi:hypothetical protein
MKTRSGYLVLLALFVIAIGLAVSLTRNSDTATPPVDRRQEGDEVPLSKHFTDPRIGVAFSYPTGGEDVQVRYYTGTAGEGFQGSIDVPVCTAGACSLEKIFFGGVTADFAAERETAPAEIGRFMRQDGKYYLTQSGGLMRKIEYPIEEVNARNSTGIILSGGVKEDMQQLGPSEKLAIFNLPGSAFQAISFNWESEAVPDTQVKAILQSLVISQ